MLYAQIIVVLVSMASNYFEYQLLLDYQSGNYVSREQAEADGAANDYRQSLVGFLFLIIFAVSGFMILRWIHRANHNARALGANNMRFSPGWSIGFYFIPVLALWKPYQAMKEIWQASKKPSDWESQYTSGIVQLWWLVWLASSFLGYALLRSAMRVEDLQDLINLNIFDQVGCVLSIFLALIFLNIVKRIHNFQTSHLASTHNEMQATPASVG
ncbi:hypothetical protein CWE14_06485 [Aliidiomarina soli]|uniref:DUF4328 domain-containing protein n=2 Tax=Aliidiomarina soli TaxID=1928574 RepID=A0A432WJS1_9GAMM|nr:hypothetical protein CWE14_06485 [Aliidiomarina soli]